MGSTQSKSESGRVPTLDGLRALSLAMVFVAHQFLDAPGLYPLGQAGVRVFFVISGFIITHLLLKERAATGTLSLRAFYLRRTWRIFPPCYAYVAAIYLASRFGASSPVPDLDILHALTYTSNYAAAMHPKLAHLWSLSVEEQFYLLWPLGFKAAGPDSGRKILVAVLFVVPLLRAATVYGVVPGHNLGWTFDTVADALATGCLVALIPSGSGWARRLRALPTFVGEGIFLVVPSLCMLWENLDPKNAAILAPTLSNLAIGLFVYQGTRFEASGFLVRLLNLPAIAQVGLWSYSLYLWQQPFLPPASPPRLVNTFPVNYLVIFALGLTSYYGIERTSMRMRRWFERRRPDSRREPAPAGTG